MEQAPDTPTIDPTVRELHAADGPAVIELFQQLSGDDRFHRFLRPMPTYPAALLALLTAMDGDAHVAVGAFAGGTCIGVARYVRLSGRPAVAELAVTVAAGHRGLGLAGRLIGALDHLARQRGVEEFEINVHPMNRKALTLFASLGFTTRFDDGAVVGHRPVGRIGHHPPHRPAPAPAGLALAAAA